MTTIETGLGSIGVTATFVQDSDLTDATSFLTNGQYQSSYGGQSNMFAGSPDPGGLPALGVITNAAGGCGGAVGTSAHQNFNGSCDVGTLTLTFDQPVTDPVMDISGLGGYRYSSAGYAARGSFNATEWTLTTTGVGFGQLSTGATNLKVEGNVLQVEDLNTWTQCTVSRNAKSTLGNGPSPVTAGCGSVVLEGTFQTLTFELASRATPYTAFNRTTYATDSSFFSTSGLFDGINGANVENGETIVGTGDRSGANYDKQRISLRLPLGSIDGQVWLDDGDGIRSNVESSVSGVTVQLLDTDGAVVAQTTSGSDGAYRFDGLPFGDYSVQFADYPDGLVPTVQYATSDTSIDSDAGADGKTGTITINAANPERTNVDAGLWDAPPSSTVVVEHVDEDGNEVFPSTSEDGAPEGDYSTVPVEDEDWILVETPENSEGSFPEDGQTTTVTYVYAKAGHLEVNHVDEDGNVLAPQVTDKDKVGADYDTSQVEIPGYELIEVPGNAGGRYTEGTTVVTYVYKPVPPSSTVVVEHVDEDGNEVFPSTSED
ncbi:MucBP domain-containing protein, partial [Pseudactinotalea sp. HY160]|uniref:MucBP domain-containing protein n=1 Tax=Pseudactinotalea sp. HY160 TaxID=2654490 RepID=UPI0018839B8E